MGLVGILRREFFVLVLHAGDAAVLHTHDHYPRSGNVDDTVVPVGCVGEIFVSDRHLFESNRRDPTFSRY